MARKVNTEIWLSEIKPEHKAKHDYSRVVYTGSNNKVEIGCLKHGTFFWQAASSHRSGCGCPICADENGGNSQRLTQEEFVNRSAKLSTDYDHSLVKYVSIHTKVDIICNIGGHGVFSMTPANRIKGQGCPKCGQILRTKKSTKTPEKFLEQCRQKHANTKLTFDTTVYTRDVDRVNVNCSEHGPFSIIASNLLQGQGCPDCSEWQCGYRYKLPGTLYILSDGLTTKVGITNRKPEVRVKEVQRSGGPTLSIIASFYFKDGKHPRAMELEAHKWLEANSSRTDAVFNGSTECFLNVDLPALLAFVAPLATIPEVA